MADLTQPQALSSPRLSLKGFRSPALLVVTSIVALLAGLLALRFSAYTPQTEIFLDSTLGELAVWMADQTTEDEIESALGRYAENRAQANGLDELPAETLLANFRTGLVWWTWAVVVLSFVGVVALQFRLGWARVPLMLGLLGLTVLIYIVPPTEGDTTVGLVLIGMALMIGVIAAAPGHLGRVTGFFLVLVAFVVVWETSKAIAAAFNYRISVPQAGWGYDAYNSLENALDDLAAGGLDVVITDRRDLDELMAPHPQDPDEFIDPATTAYPSLRYVEDLEREAARFGFATLPEFPGRLAVALPADGPLNITQPLAFNGMDVGTVADEFAETGYLIEPRQLVLLDMKIANDLNLPHLQSIAEALLQPARRNGPVLLVRILGNAALYTWGEALAGFIGGGILGFALATFFVHSPVAQRGLLPYVVASQTVPIIAIAPMVVIWLGAGPVSVAVIASYLTFFPVTINTLRGLQSPSPMAMDLMHSYAASPMEIMLKLRLPAALPYIFTALKVAATASVVGAIIGELPSSIRDGLGRAIIDFSSDYSLISTPKLWAAIFMAALVGIAFFIIVTLIEMLVLRGRLARASAR